MKNYYAILEVPVGCGVADIRQAYRRLAQDNLDNEAVFAELKEAHEVLTTPARRADYDRAVWGETFMAGGADGATQMLGATQTLGATQVLNTTQVLGAAQMPGGAVPAVLDSPAGAGRCPMGDGAQCPVLLGRAGPADTYCPECGFLLAGLSDAPAFEVPEPDGGGIRLEETGGRSHRLRVGLNIVGRESADVLLPDKTVSRQHARLDVGEDGTIIIEDLGSTNGTQVGAEVLVPHMNRTLQAGDRVRFGSVVTELRLPGEAPADPTDPSVGALLAAPSSLAAPSASAPSSAPAPPPEAAPRGPARARLVETREEGGRTFPLAPGVTTFGRRVESTVVIQGDPYVSGSHAQIVADGDVFVLTDVGSTNGTLLNGRRLVIGEPETLTPGDTILIGGTALRFEMLEAPEEADAGEADAGEAVAAEPRERTAPEYDVPETEGPTQDTQPQDTQPQDTQPQDAATHDIPTQVER